jgi:diguanylate cyclase (GGDEF)-like protein
MYFSIHAVNKHLLDNITLRVEAELHDEKIKQLAFHDVLTGLPNRRLLQDRLTHALNLSARNNSTCAVIFMDLNQFKQLNDTQGHDVGDLLLQQVAIRLKTVVRESDTVARLGGDEFVILLQNLKGNNKIIDQELNRVAEDIITTFNQPIILKETPYIARLSMGASIFGIHGNSPNELLKSADSAMYQAKRSGEKSMRIFNTAHS